MTFFVRIQELSSYTASMIVKNHLIPKFGNLKLDAITSETVDGWLLSFPDRGLSNGTDRLAKRCLSRAFSILSMPGVRSMFCSLVLWAMQAMWNESLGNPFTRYFFVRG